LGYHTKDNYIKKIVFKSGDQIRIISSATAEADGNIHTIFLPREPSTLISSISKLSKWQRKTKN